MFPRRHIPQYENESNEQDWITTSDSRCFPTIEQIEDRIRINAGISFYGPGIVGAKRCAGIAHKAIGTGKSASIPA